MNDNAAPAPNASTPFQPNMNASNAPTTTITAVLMAMLTSTRLTAALWSVTFATNAVSAGVMKGYQFFSPAYCPSSKNSAGVFAELSCWALGKSRRVRSPGAKAISALRAARYCRKRCMLTRLAPACAAAPMSSTAASKNSVPRDFMECQTYTKPKFTRACALTGLTAATTK
jgi:hypothetical protein